MMPSHSNAVPVLSLMDRVPPLGDCVARSRSPHDHDLCRRRPRARDITAADRPTALATSVPPSVVALRSSRRHPQGVPVNGLLRDLLPPVESTFLERARGRGSLT